MGEGDFRTFNSGFLARAQERRSLLVDVCSGFKNPSAPCAKVEFMSDAPCQGCIDFAVRDDFALKEHLDGKSMTTYFDQTNVHSIINLGEDSSAVISHLKASVGLSFKGKNPETE